MRQVALSLLAAALLSVSSVSTASAQDANAEEIYSGKHKSWEVLCFRNLITNHEYCNTMQIWGENTSEFPLLLLVQRSKGTEGIIFVSPRSYQPDTGILFRVDENKPMGINTGNSEFAGIAPEEAANVLNQMKAGQQLLVRYQPPGADVQTATFSLLGFTAALNDIRSRLP